MSMSVDTVQPIAIDGHGSHRTPGNAAVLGHRDINSKESTESTDAGPGGTLLPMASGTERFDLLVVDLSVLSRCETEPQTLPGQKEPTATESRPS